MREPIIGRPGLAVAACTLFFGLLTACADAPNAPAPVYMGDMRPSAPSSPPPQWRENTVITVKQGQTLLDIAHTYHVPEHAIVAANQLKPPYKLQIGARLVIPNGPPPPIASAAPPAARPLAASTPPPTIVAAVSPPPTAPQFAAPASQAPTPQGPTALTPPRPAPSSSQVVATPTPVQSPTPPAPQIAAQPNIVPLDMPPRPVAVPAKPEPAPLVASAPAATASGAPAVLPARNPAAALPLPGEGPAPAPTEPAVAAGRFPWPVNGKILANYGTGAGPSHNEGINISAPRGTPVHAIDSGTIAYVGNEVQGYGNLVLVKHANGWISAYAHLDGVTVKKGDSVSAGQIIGQVGSTGGVDEPQLHFELRRGKRPVDPREFLAPAPSAAVRPGQPG
jgi:murein DD-endopeptidase MepM/ murein hydrolase activator NlpD